MAFTNAWDAAQPPDTQQANLLGQDLRNLKTDIQQRLPNSGADAAKPNYEAVFAGVLYFATDTAKIYQWSGVAWVDVTANFVPQQYRKFTVQGGATVANGATLLTINIPANLLVIGSVIDVSTMIPVENAQLNFNLNAANVFGFVTPYIQVTIRIQVRTLTLLDIYARYGANGVQNGAGVLSFVVANVNTGGLTITYTQSGVGGITNGSTTVLVYP